MTREQPENTSISKREIYTLKMKKPISEIAKRKEK